MTLINQLLFEGGHVYGPVSFFAFVNEKIFLQLKKNSNSELKKILNKTMGNMLMVAHAMQLCVSDDKNLKNPDAHSSTMKGPAEKGTSKVL